jgi:DNA processing protein
MHARAWLHLSATPGLGPADIRALLGAFGPPESIFAQDADRLTAVVGAARAHALIETNPVREAAVHRALEWLDGQGERTLLTLDDPAYPVRLLDLADPPCLLYVLGDPARLKSPSMAIVGSRQASVAGLEHARHFAQHLSQAGLTILSGLAQGIDGAAHAGALGQDGGTVAFIGTGIDRVYPAQHQALARSIVERGGAIASELALGTPPHPSNFPRRNRLIAAAAQGVLVVEAAARSGSLITARLAADLGRDVFAIPGSIHSALARGCHALLREGAKLVETAHDVLAELPQLATLAPARAATLERLVPPSQHDPALEQLGWEPAGIETLILRSGEPAACWNVRLLGWELHGVAARLEDGRWQRLR